MIEPILEFTFWISQLKKKKWVKTSYRSKYQKKKELLHIILHPAYTTQLTCNTITVKFSHEIKLAV